MKKYLLSLLLLGLNAAAAAQDAPLLDAIRANDPDQVKTAVAAGTDVNQRFPDMLNATPLMLAMSKDNPDLTRALLAAGAKVNARDRMGDPAINWASYYGLTGQVRLLLEHGARTDLFGHGTAADIAMRRGHQELVLLLVRHNGTAPPVAAEVQALQEAIDSGGTLSPNGKAVTALDDTGRPLIARAARQGHAEQVRQLHAAGAAVDATGPIGFTPLMEAAREGHAQVVQALLELGADPGHAAYANGLGMSPLHLAAISGQADVIRPLLAAGAALDARDSLGASPALWALYSGQEAACLMLLQAGASATQAANSGDSVSSAATAMQAESIVKWLEQNPGQ